MYFDRNGKQIPAALWSALYDDIPYRIIKQSTMLDGKFISTVWLGLDHGYDKDNRPLIFETLVFSRSGEFGEIDGARYATLRQARDGHRRMVKKWLLKTGDDE